MGKYEQKIADHIAQVVAARRIEDVLHFTRLEYLPSILKHGLRARSELEGQGMAFKSPRRDGEDSAVSVSLSCYYPRMFMSKRADAPNTPFAILVLHASLLWEHPCLFYRYSVLSRDTAYENQQRHGGWALQKLFDDNGLGFRARHNLPHDFPTFAESEVQVLSPIHSSYIRGVWVETSENGDAVRQFLLSEGRSDCGIHVQPFSPRFGNGAYEWG